MKKQRELWIWKQTRIHLDEVDQLGSFIELETVLEEIDEVQGRDQMQQALHIFGLGQAERVPVPYLELIEQNPAKLV